MSHRPLHIVTPTFASMPLNSITGKQIYLKMECYQPVGSFKIRGIGLLCQQLQQQGCEAFVASSGGNAGFAVAYAARLLKIPAKIFVPKTTSPTAIHMMELQHAEVIVEGDAWDDSNQAALAYTEKHQAGFIPPFDHPTLWHGHATIIDELVQQIKKPDAIIVSVGGGGLASGLLEGMHKHHWHDVPLITVETNGADSLAQSLAVDKLITLPSITSIATTLGAKRVCENIFNWRKKHELFPVVISDKKAVKACYQFLDDHRVLVEPACGVSLSVVYEDMRVLRQYEKICVIVCGGVGISLEQLAQFKKSLS